jgi:zinc transport system substrate-binding protein
MRTACGEKLNLFFPEVTPGQVMDRETVKRVQASRLILLDGTHHVGWVDTVSMPESRKRFSTFDIMDQLIMVDNLGSHSHGPDGEHSHKGIVAQTWLDPALFKRQLQTSLLACAKSGLLDESEVEDMVERWWATVLPMESAIHQMRELPVRRVISDRAGTEYLFRRLGWPVEIQDLEGALVRDRGQFEIELRERFQQDNSLVVVLTERPSSGLEELLRSQEFPVVSLDLIDDLKPSSYLERMDENLKNLKNLSGLGL